MKKHFCLALLLTILLTGLVLVGCKQTSGQTRAKGGQQTQEGTQGTRVSYIDVGKGDCILIQTGGVAALVDTGYSGTYDKVVSYLRKQGVERLDCIVLSHYDKDHVGGIAPIAQIFPTDTVFLPGYEGSDNNYYGTIKAIETLDLPVRQVTTDASHELGDARLDLFPSKVAYVSGGKGEEGNDNDCSLVAALVCGGDSYLFAGDLEDKGIASFTKEGHGHYDVLKMPHHGERAKNTDDLLEEVQPKIAIITDSQDQPADKKLLKSLKKRGVDTHRTSVDGTIVVEGDGAGSYSVTTASK